MIINNHGRKDRKENNARKSNKQSLVLAHYFLLENVENTYNYYYISNEQKK
jgi:hypothetical protein